jgi:hypothetical protein
MEWPPLQRQRQLAPRGAVEVHRRPVEQDTPQHQRSFLGQDTRGRRVAVTRAGAQDVLNQRGRRIALAAIDDAALGPEGVGIFRLCGARGHRHLHAAVGQLQCGRRAGDAAAENKNFCFEIFAHETTYISMISRASSPGSRL